MLVTVINSNPTTSTQHTPLAFSAADFQKWNQTTSMIHLPAKLVGKDKIPKLRGEIVTATGEKKVATVHALSPTKYRIEFRSCSYRSAADFNGISFQGVTLTPRPEYEEVKSVFVDRAPLQMPDQEDNSSVKDAPTPASLFGTIDLPSPELSQYLFNLLVAAPVLADSTESDSRLASVPPDAELFSNPAGQDRVRELMLELPTFNLE